MRETGGAGESDGDGLAMEVGRVTRDLLDGVPEGVAQVQQRPAVLGGGLVFVRRHDAGLEFAATADDCRQIGAARIQNGFLQPGEKRGIAEQAIFDHLRHASGKFPRGQRRQQTRGKKNRPRVVKRPGQVFPRREIDARFAADGTVHHREQGRRHLDVVDAPEVGRRRKPTEIAHHPTPGHPQHALPGDFVRREKIEHLPVVFK